MDGGDESTLESSDEEVVEEYWDIDIDDVLKDFDQENSIEEEIPKSNCILNLFLMFLLLWASFYNISATALNYLIQFLYQILSIIAPKSPTIAALLTSFPKSLYMLKKFYSLNKDKFHKYVICPKCNALYQFNECLQTRPTGQSSPKVCSNVAYRNHLHLSRRKACGNCLREIVTKSVLPFENLLLLLNKREYDSCPK